MSCRISVSPSGVPPCLTVDFYLRLCVVLVLCCLFGVVAVNMEASRKISGNSWASFLVTLAMNDSYQPRISIFEKKTWDYPTDLCISEMCTDVYIVSLTLNGFAATFKQLTLPCIA